MRESKAILYRLGQTISTVVKLHFFAGFVTLGPTTTSSASSSQ
jgi:hypothetical protein